MAYIDTIWQNDAGQPINAANLNHIEQGIKNCLSVTTSTGTAPTYSLSIAGITSLSDLTWYPLYMRFNQSTTSIATLNVNGYGARSILGLNGTTFIDSPRIQVNMVYLIVFNGTNFIIVNCNTGVTLTASKALVSGVSGDIISSNTTSTEIGYISGLTSPIQTQLSGKLGVSAQAVDSLKVNGKKITVGTSAPSAPEVGELWVDSN